MLLNALTWTALVMSVLSFALFAYLSIRKVPGAGARKSGEGELRGHGSLSDITALAKALGELTDAFQRAGPAISALIASILFFLIATLGAGLERIAK
jgi:hypothetical protein